MVSVIFIIPMMAVGYWVFSLYSRLQIGIKAAKASGLPYIVTPINLFDTWWLVTHNMWLPWLRKLPTSWTDGWLDLLVPDWVYTLGYAPFAKTGDTFLTVAPTGTMVWTASPEVIRHLTTKRDDFPKPLKNYKALDIFGRNVVTTEGLEWKNHRKITAPGFSEKSNVMVFRESVAQTQGMLRKWENESANGKPTLTSVPEDTMRLTLYIISRVGFGVRLLWKGEEPTAEDKLSDSQYSSSQPAEGHTMSFENSLESLLANLIWVLLLPKWLIKLMPFASAKVAYESLENWGQYMNELFAKKVIEAQKGERSGGMDIMGSLVRSAYSDVELSKSKASPGNAEKGQAGKIQALTDDEILGNAFVMILAGHETTANSIHFSLVMLAMAAGSQRRLQRELTAIFGNSEPETWDYESNINALLGGMAGAVLNEELRILPPVINLPKSVRKDQDVPMIVDGQKYLFPKGAYINISIAAVHKNDKFWPSRGPSKITDSKNDLGDFIPERWLLNNNIAVPKTDLPHIDDPEGNDAYGGFTGTSTAAGLVRPTAGSYMPFSDGARSCLGRRLAQVEMMAMIAVIFQKWSVELAVDDWATDEEVKKMGSKEKKELYEKAMERTRTDLLAATSRITLKLHEGRTYIPMRLVKRGEERFLGLFD